MSLTQRFAHTIWCDDIRQEVGNKPSFMGVFTGGILLPSLPVVLPRLGVQTWVVSPIESPIQSLQLQIVRDDGVVLAEIRPEGPAHSGFPRVEDATRQQINIGVTMGPVELPIGCKWLVVKVKADDDEFDGPKLRITANAESFAAMTLGSGAVEFQAQPNLESDESSNDLKP